MKMTTGYVRVPIRVLTAALVLVLLGFSTARAETAEFAASSYPAHAVALNDGIFTLASSLGEITCMQSGESQPFDATAVLEEEGEELTGSSIQYTNCQLTVLKLPVTIDMNGCDYLFTGGEVVSATTAEGGTQIQCPEGQAILVTIFGSTTEHTEGVAGCVLRIPKQTPSSGLVVYHDIATENGQSVVTIDAKELTLLMVRTGGSLCTFKIEENAYSGSFIAEATEGIGIAVAGAPTSAGAALSATNYPAHLIAVNSGTFTLMTAGLKYTCVQTGETLPFGLTAILEKESAEVTGEAIQFSGCHFSVVKWPVTIDMNGCDYRFTLDRTVSSTKAIGSTYIECPMGKEIKVTLFSNSSQHEAGSPGCVTDIPAQTPSVGSVTYNQVETESGQKAVTITLDSLSVSATRTEGLLCSSGNTLLSQSVSFTIEATEGVGVELVGAG